jgi:hypothetical protein
MTQRLRWMGPMLLAALVGGCGPSSGDSAAAANVQQGENEAVAAPSAEADNGVAPIDNVALPAAAVDPEQPAMNAEAPPPSLDLPASNAADEPVAFPAEVTAFMVDRDGCDHFRGEEPYDAERAAYLDQSIRELCTGSDARLARLRRRYAENAEVIAALDKYEERIEAPDKP